MRDAIGNIWDYVETHDLVITTNIGWRSDGRNIMGAGLALTAAQRYPGIDAWYGAFCQKHSTATPVVRHPDLPIILFPVKSLKIRWPWRSWQYPASLDLIERSTRQLAGLVTDRPVAVPVVGCGAGQLQQGEVLPILRKYLVDDRFVLVRTPAMARAA